MFLFTKNHIVACRRLLLLELQFFTPNSRLTKVIYVWGYQVISLLLSGSSWGERTKTIINKHFLNYDYMPMPYLPTACHWHAIGKSKDDRPRIPELPKCKFFMLVWPFQSFPFWRDSSIFPVVSGPRNRRGRNIAWTCCRWSRVAGTLSSTPLVKGAEGLFYSSDLGENSWGGKTEPAGGFPRFQSSIFSVNSMGLVESESTYILPYKSAIHV